MKNIFLLLLISLFASNTIFGQVIDRSKPPNPKPARAIKIPDPQKFVLPNGMKIIVVSNKKQPVVFANLLVDIPPILEAEKVGSGDVFASMLSRGTTTKTKVQLDEEVDFLGANLNVSASNASISSLKKNFSQAASILADVVLRPSFPAVELEKVKTQIFSGLEAQSEEPNAISQKVTNALLYGKQTAMGEFPTKESIEAIELFDIKAHYQKWWRPNWATIIFIGDISGKEAYQIALQKFGKWKPGIKPKYIQQEPIVFSKPLIAIIDKPEAPQSVISLVSTNKLKPGTVDAIPASLVSTILGGGMSSRLNQNLREKYGFTYGAGGSINPSRYIGTFKAGASVRTEKTDSAIQQFLYEFDRIRTEEISLNEISDTKNYMAGGFARSLEQAATIANFAYNIEINKLPKDYYRNYLKVLDAATQSELAQIAKKYVPAPGLLITVVGNAAEIGNALEKYGDVKYFDKEANEIKKPNFKLTSTVTYDPNEVMQKFLNASGTEKLVGIKDIKLIGKLELMKNELDLTINYLFPDHYNEVISIQGQTLMKKSKKGAEFSNVLQGTNKPMEESDKNELNAAATFFHEAYFMKTEGYKIQADGTEMVNGNEAFKIRITESGGLFKHRYYDLQTAMLVKVSEKKSGGPKGEITISTYFSDYKKFHEINIATKMVMNYGEVKQNVSINDVQINNGLKPEDF